MKLSQRKDATDLVEFLRRSWAVVDLDKIDLNIRAIKEKLRPGCMIMGIVKADAYGHGDKYIADELIKLGVNWFGVSNLNEAMSLRNQGIYHPILILGTTPPNKAKVLCEYNITQAVFSLDYARKLQNQAERFGVTVTAHIKVDTGMGRIGFDADADLDTAISQICEVCNYTNLHCDGIFTHFSSADEYNEDSIEYTNHQFSLFMKTCNLLEEQGFRFSLRHCCNSGGIVNYPSMQLDMVRAGILIYGLTPDKACDGKISLYPAMQLHSVVSMVKDVQTGSKLSYGRTFTAEHPMRIATVPIGYADGYHRMLSNRGKMLVNGQFANIVGRICMDQLMLDVTGIPDVTEGMQITIMGEENGNRITMEEIAALTDTVNYEIMCIIGRRVPRVYRRHGKDIGVVDYIRHKVE